MGGPESTNRRSSVIVAERVPVRRGGVSLLLLETVDKLLIIAFFSIQKWVFKGDTRNYPL